MWWCKKTKKETNIDDLIFTLTIMLKGDDEHHLSSANSFIDEINKKGIFDPLNVPFSPIKPFTNSDGRISCFGVSVDKKYKNDVLEIHKKIYGLKKNK